MDINYNLVGKIYEKIFFKDKVTIYRRVETKDKYGATKVNEKSKIYENIPCKLSFKDIDKAWDNDDTKIPISKEITLFMKLDYQLQAGDMVEVIRENKDNKLKSTIAGMIGLPNRFDTHQEIPIQIKGEN